MIPGDINIFNRSIINFYTNVTGIAVNDVTEIPNDSLCIILRMNYVDIIQPLVINDKKNKNLSLRFLSKRYGVGVSVIRSIVSTLTQ